ncbi:phycobilisome rod-core linker polypeptide CpcG1 [Scytonema hofmannii PCC 7110]|uniref:Phycobilisome rod-core linker polypeptide CpcG1 n=1 Tax=Scytonema hofmannii PCC 7110 TaxID=128403 RepID=A0A139WW75_9CYAN|nr:phycobilisome rod-core linker polypeptide [Scytonema hofmannii]KYC36685.1 phycobilisome rod-core linker polypeptide CpcG1 [Scytonema hofmannii PCC 7110]
MSIPLLESTPITQNQRVDGYEVPNEDTPQIYRSTDAISNTDIDAIIWAGYRQIFSEHLILDSYRLPFLESQLRNGAITVRDFIRGLGKSEVYRSLVGDTNSNYRLVDISFKRFLGRATYGKDEQIAWSIVIATKGLNGFIDALVDGDEYRQNFDNDIVPYQRRRFKDRPFNLVNPRYADYWRNRELSISLGATVYYQAAVTGQSVQRGVRGAIPSNFLTMAASIAPGGLNYQRSQDRARNYISNVDLPEAYSQTAAQPTVKPTKVNLPYSYIPGNQTV